jgi:hypothetical protein
MAHYLSALSMTTSQPISYNPPSYPASYTQFLADIGEYIRPAQAPRFGISRSSAYNLISDGVLKTRVIRRPGTKKGIRLIETASLRAYTYIENSPSK